MLVYITKNLVNEKIYIGQTIKSKKEFLESNYFGSGFEIRQALNKYGEKNFSRKILQVCESKKELDLIERYYIKIFSCQDPEIGYNIGNGGEGFGHGRNNVAKQISVRKKLSDKAKCRKHSLKTRQKMSENRKGIKHPMFGKHRSEETKNKIRQTFEQNGTVIGKNNPFYGKHHSTESRKKISEANTGKHHSEKVKLKMSEAQKEKNNPMFGRCAYDIWLEKYGKEEADRRKSLRNKKHKNTLSTLQKIKSMETNSNDKNL